ncbi:hypothetical protein F0562_019857 [Nyssa sinensis]|uniref:Uncharacterized protein n=1 Tax=Nyssa sinensis TaxID=561372 RepID=A0A5J5BQX6_9ASTE|nr:hypothetical protein F0562_019857 [Nyssa sinensis]
MAKKKVTHQDKQPQSEEQTHQAAAMVDTSEKLESLKSLNAILLKETVERRQQVDSLLQSQGSLESELTRSEMEKEALQAELSLLSDRTVQMELERNLVFVFVAVQVNQQAELIEMERDGFGRDKAEVEERLQNLEREMSDIVREKSEIEKMKSEKESEIEFLKKKLSVLVVEIDNSREVSSLAGRERDAMRSELDLQIEETNGLSLKLVEAEKRQTNIQEELRQLEMQYNGIMQEKVARERRIESMIRDKDSIQRSLAESNRVIEDLKREIDGIVREKEGIEEERKVEVKKKNELENVVTALNEMVLGLQKEEQRLRLSVADLEKRCVEGVEKQKQMQSDEQKRKTDQLVREKIEIEVVKARKESEIVEMQKEMAELKDAILTLEKTCRGQIEKIKQLESEISIYKESLDRVVTERDEAIKGLDGEKKMGMNLSANLMELEKNIEKTGEEMGQMKTENGSLLGEKKELESRCAMLMEVKASLEKELLEVQKGMDDKQAKVKLADANLELALSMLRNTAAMVSLSKDESGVMDDNLLLDDQKVGEDVKPYVAELETIKNAFKNRERAVEDMKRQLELLHNSVAEAHKKKNFWTLVSSATTIFAAAFAAYVARGR